MPGKCVECGAHTDFCCSDCGIDGKGNVYICTSKECDHKHWPTNHPNVISVGGCDCAECQALRDKNLTRLEKRIKSKKC